MMDRFDVNAYFGHWPFWRVPQTSPDELIALMDRHDIRRAAVMSLRGLYIDWQAGNDEALDASAKYPDRFVPAATISPFPGGGGDAVRRVVGRGARLIKLFPGCHNYRLSDPFVDEICEAATEQRVPVSIPTRIMTNWRFQPLPLAEVASVVERQPATMFVLSGPNYLAEFRDLVHLMRRSSNTVCETSCMQGYDSIGRLAGEVGNDRVLFGTGAVLNNPSCNVAKLDHATVSEEHRVWIAWRNAERLLGRST